jgi:hypothetical protein
MRCKPSDVPLSLIFATVLVLFFGGILPALVRL